MMVAVFYGDFHPGTWGLSGHYFRKKTTIDLVFFIFVVLWVFRQGSCFFRREFFLCETLLCCGQ
jgi:hypothetical protein